MQSPGIRILPDSDRPALDPEIIKSRSISFSPPLIIWNNPFIEINGKEILAVSLVEPNIEAINDLCNQIRLAHKLTSTNSKRAHRRTRHRRKFLRKLESRLKSALRQMIQLGMI